MTIASASDNCRDCTQRVVVQHPQLYSSTCRSTGSGSFYVLIQSRWSEKNLLRNRDKSKGQAASPLQTGRGPYGGGREQRP